MAELPRYAGKGFALDCLSGPMPTPFEQHYTYLELRSGAVICPRNSADFSGQLLAAILVVLHATLCLLPCFTSMIIFQRYRNQTRAKAFSVLFFAMGIFSMGALGEVTQHMLDNWLYLGLIPTFNSGLFYGGLTLGQALLAWGIGGFGPRVVIDLLASAAVYLGLFIATFRAANSPAPTAGPIPIVYIVAFTGLTVTTLDYILSSFGSFGGMRRASNWRFAAGVVIAYAAGVVCSIQIESSGNQRWHVPTASGFVSGFFIQVWWLTNGMGLKDRVA